VPQGCGKTVLEIANACEGTNLAQFEAAGIDSLLDLVFVHISNGRVETPLGCFTVSLIWAIYARNALSAGQARHISDCGGVERNYASWAANLASFQSI